MTLLIINVVSVSCAIIMALASQALYRLTRSTGVFVLFVGCLYLTVVRIIIAGAETFSPSSPVLGYRSYIIAAFWPVMTTGFVLLLRSLRKLYQNGYTRREDAASYVGPERRKNATSTEDQESP